MATICVYGDFEKKDIRIKIVSNQEQYTFQNTLKSAGYDAELFSLDENEIKEKNAQDYKI